MGIKKSGNANSGINYEVVEKCGVISQNNGYSTELRYMKWGDNAEKYDIRTWYTKDGVEKCTKGITLTGEELEALGKLIMDMAKED